MNLEIGQRVSFRSLQWEVSDNSSGTLVELYGRSEENRGRKVQVLLDLEPIERTVIPPLEWTIGKAGWDTRQWKALHDAFRFTLSHSRGNLVSVDWGRLILEPYQLVPLQRIENLPFPRLLLADDTGLGKTAEAGLILFRLMQKRRADRLLVLCKARPEPERWQRELSEKFGIETVIINDHTDYQRLRREVPSHLNLFGYYPRIVMSMHFASQPHIMDDLGRDLRWDVVIIDEAHHLAARDGADKRLTELGRTVADKSEALLLLTATPHDGKSSSFASLINLLDPYAVVDPDKLDPGLVRPLLVRRLKQQVVKADHTHFQQRDIHILEVDEHRSRAERGLEAALRRYTSQLNKQAQNFKQKGQRKEAFGADFLETFFKKRLASSVYACRLSLQERLRTVQNKTSDEQNQVPMTEMVRLGEQGILEQLTDEAPSTAELQPLVFDNGQSEQEILQDLLERAAKIKDAQEAKVVALLNLLKRKLVEPHEKVVIFTEYRDTLELLEQQLNANGYGPMLLTYHGGTPSAEREQKRQAFLNQPQARIFLATDAASEGINLHKSCSILIHIEIPWNPNRYEQRNGRIDRYGQERRPEIFLLVAARSIEQRVAQVVVQKLERIEREVGSVSNVFPVAQRVKIDDFLKKFDEAQAGIPAEIDEVGEATTHAEQAALQIEQELDKALLEDKQELAGDIGTELLAGDNFDQQDVARLQKDLDASRQFVPQYSDVEDFLKVFVKLPEMDNGQLKPNREPLIFTLDVPDHPQLEVQDAHGRAVKRYPRVTFSRKAALEQAELDSQHRAEFLSPGHPFVKAALRYMRGQVFNPQFMSRLTYRRTAPGSTPGFIFTYALRFVDGRGEAIEERFEAVWVALDGQVSQQSENDLHLLTAQKSFGNLSPQEEADLLPRFEAAFASARTQAEIEIQRRSRVRVDELKKSQEQISDKALMRLGSWKHASEQRLNQRFPDVAGTATGQGQFDLFGEQRRRETLFRREQQKLLAQQEQRYQEIKLLVKVSGETIDPIGALVLIPEAML